MRSTMDESPSIPFSMDVAALCKPATVDSLSLETEPAIWALDKPNELFQITILTIPLAVEDLSVTSPWISSRPRSLRKTFARQLFWCWHRPAPWYLYKTQIDWWISHSNHYFGRALLGLKSSSFREGQKLLERKLWSKARMMMTMPPGEWTMKTAATENHRIIYF